MRSLGRLSMQDRAALGIFLAYLLFVAGTLLLEARASSTPTEPAVDRDQQVLDRLEQGETLRVPRWHGHDLLLEGTLLVDTSELDTEDESGGSDG